MASIFTRIIEGEIPCHKVAENDDFLAFLDISPRTKGHTLVVPKQEVDYLFDLDASTYAELWQFARQVASAIEQVVTCERIGIAVIGLEVPHTHVHLVPLHGMGDIDFSRPPHEMTQDELAALAQAIREKFVAG
jgi:histidine triad (HIT) family protein